MYYEINVSYKGSHFFATAKRSAVTVSDARKLLKDFLVRFPKEEGWQISCSLNHETGEIIDIPRFLGVFKPNCFMTLTNLGGIEAELSRSGDGIRYRFVYGETDISNEEICEAEIEIQSLADDPDYCEYGFWHGDTFYELKNFMRS